MSTKIAEAMKLLESEGYFVTGGPKKLFITKTSRVNFKSKELKTLYGATNGKIPTIKKRTEGRLTYSGIENREYAEIDPDSLKWIKCEEEE